MRYLKLPECVYIYIRYLQLFLLNQEMVNAGWHIQYASCATAFIEPRDVNGGKLTQIIAHTKDINK